MNRKKPKAKADDKKATAEKTKSRDQSEDLRKERAKVQPPKSTLREITPEHSRVNPVKRVGKL